MSPVTENCYEAVTGDILICQTSRRCRENDASMATMRQVAQRAGVSAKTVSRVMNSDRYVSGRASARERAIEDLQYVPNLLARTFRYGRDAAIGIAVPDISDPFFSAVIHAVEEIARDRGVALFVTSVGDGAARMSG